MENINIFLGLLILFGVGMGIIATIDNARRKQRGDIHQ